MLFTSSKSFIHIQPRKGLWKKNPFYAREKKPKYYVNCFQRSILMRMKFLLANQTDSHAISKSAIPTLHLAVCYGCKGVIFFFFIFFCLGFSILCEGPTQKKTKIIRPMKFLIRKFSENPCDEKSKIFLLLLFLYFYPG